MNAELEHRHPVAFQALRVLKYGYRLGVLRGPLTWIRFSFARQPVSVGFPTFRGSVLVRPRSSDVWTFEKVFISREYDLAFLRPDPAVIVDVGANVGYASVFFAETFPAARIIAVEPEATNFAMLRENTAAYPSVTPVQGALWHRPARLTIENPKDDAWAYRVRETDVPGEASLRGVSMEELFEEHQIPRIDILKIDIEGAEKDVFQPGCEAWIAKTRILVVELHDWLREGCATAFYRATSQFAFRHYTSGENVVLARSF